MRKAREEAEDALARELATKGFKAFPLVVSGADLDATVELLVQTAGAGPLRINTVLVNWMEETSQTWDTHKVRQFGRNLHAAFLLGRNVLLLDAEPQEWKHRREHR